MISLLLILPVFSRYKSGSKKKGEGWRSENSKTFPKSGWTIEDNAMKCVGSGQGEAGGEGNQ